MIQFIEGGVTAAKGFKASGVHCGIRKNRTKKDLALIVSDTLCSAAAVYTQNLVKGAPLIVTQKNLANGHAQAVICNSGNANTCNANGEEIANAMCALVAGHTGIAAGDVIVASTGVIGQPLNLSPIESGMPALVSGLSTNGAAAAEAIMTTDTVMKEVAVEFEIEGKKCRLGGIAKGSGMIHPNMATLLVFLTTDVDIPAQLLSDALKADVGDSFNMVSVDGDTSTNDMLTIMANGASGARIASNKDAGYAVFCDALAAATQTLCRMIARDGEGATRLIECRVSGAKTKADARLAARGIVSSTLLKCAIFGADANWGRVLCAIGYSGAAVSVEKANVVFSSSGGSVEVCKNGSSVAFDEAVAKAVLSAPEIILAVSFPDGDAQATAWGCDMTYEYVKINGDYRT